MKRILQAVGVTAVSLLSATFAASTLVLLLPIAILLIVPIRIFSFLDGNLIQNLHLGLSFGASIAIPAGLSATIFNLGHPSWRMWLSSNAFILTRTTAVGSLVCAFLLLLDPMNFSTGFQGFPRAESLIGITSIATSGLTGGLLWYREQLRRVRTSRVIKDITAEKPA